MVAYKDILNSFGGDEGYADRFQAAALKGDNDAMQSIAAEYKNRDTTATAQQPQGQQPQQQQQQTYNGNNLGNWQYGNNTADRQEQIVSNLNKAYEQDPSKFGDWSTFSKEFNYDYSGRSDKEKETMRNWYSSIQDKQAQQQSQQQTQQGTQGQQGMQAPTQYDPNDVGNTDYYFSQLMGGTPLQGTGLAITNATTRYDNWKYLSGLQPSVIASAVEQGILSGVGQEMQDLKQYSPELYAQVQSALQGQQTLNDINEVGNGIYNGLTKTETNGNYTNYDMTSDYVKGASVIQQYNTDLYNKILGLGGDTAAYVGIVATMLQNPEIQGTKNKVEELEGEVNRIKENIYNIGDDARVALGSEAPESLVSAYISQQTKQLQNQLRTAQNSLQVEQGKLNNQLSEVDTMIDALNYGMKLQATNDKNSSSSSSTNNYQYISASKYQEAGYFDKTTGQFYRLGELPDTSDYQSSDPTRLQEIKDNLTNIASSDDAYVFRDRNSFNTYFKYSQRSAAQKKVLDDFWNANSANLKPIADKKYKEYQAAQAAKTKTSGGGGLNVGGGTNDYDSIKKAIMNGTFSGSRANSNLKKYGYKGGASDNTVLYQIGKGSKAEEIKTMLGNLPDFNDKEKLIQGYVVAHASTIRDAKGKGLFSTDKSARNKAANNMLSEIGAAGRAKTKDEDELTSLITSWIS